MHALQQPPTVHALQQPPTVHALQQSPTVPGGYPGGHYGVPPSGFAQSFMAQPFRPQQQQLHDRMQQLQSPLIMSGPAPRELPNVMNGPWWHGAETSGPSTGF